MFYGTSKVLQLAGPDAYASSLQQRLLNAFRVLEANRTIMFGDATFLSESKWRVYSSINHEGAEIPDCMASITELMIQTSAFSKRLFEQIESIPEEERLFSPTVAALAHEGTELDRKICNWYDSISLQPDPADPFTQLALAKYHAVRLFHCRNFTYYTCWLPGTIPQLDQMEIDGCVVAIIYLCEKILHSSNIPGAILLFPLRMAGAHYKFEWQRNHVRNLLNQIHKSGFVVAERIQIDLVEFWEFQDDQDSIQLSV
ncbi:hypothetical protein J3E69DRAFT_360499 [Trichoderma sp. SZMC 28015]